MLLTKIRHILQKTGKDYLLTKKLLLDNLFIEF